MTHVMGSPRDDMRMHIDDIAGIGSMLIAD